MKAMVRSLDGDIDFFDIVAGVLERDTSSLYMFIIWLDYILRTSLDLMKENGFMLKKTRSTQYYTENMIDADYVYDLVLLALASTRT